jgi:hypothetical protein
MNIVLVNFAYDLGEHLYSVYLLLLAVLLIAHDLPRLYTILVTRTRTAAEQASLFFTGTEKRFKSIIRVTFGTFTLLFVTLLIKTRVTSNWPFPDTEGLAGAYGYYNVSQFKINDSLLPYSLTDSLRWKDVVFEKWNVMSVRNNTRHKPLMDDPKVLAQHVDQPHYDALGNGGRKFYHYTHTPDEISLYNYGDISDRIQFAYYRPDSSTIVLSGQTKTGDNLLITLNKLNKEYLLYKGRRKPLTIY